MCSNRKLQLNYTCKTRHVSWEEEKNKKQQQTNKKENNLYSARLQAHAANACMHANLSVCLMNDEVKQQSHECNIIKNQLYWVTWLQNENSNVIARRIIHFFLRILVYQLPCTYLRKSYEVFYFFPTSICPFASTNLLLLFFNHSNDIRYTRFLKSFPLVFSITFYNILFGEHTFQHLKCLWTRASIRRVN